MRAFFPGKFQPPHIGHIRTINRLKQKYDVIVGITNDQSKGTVLKQKQVYRIMQECLPDTEFTIIPFTLTEMESVETLPNFDVLCSGNPKVLKWGKKMGLKCRYVKRSKGILHSGTEIRNYVKNA